MKRLVLTMIVKNEAKIITRCFDSCRSVIAGICLCDTGSSDNTVQLVEQYAREHQLPVKIEHHPWINFGHNRTLSFETARQFVKERGWPLHKTYALLLDADMTLKIGSFWLANLTAPVYSLLQVNGSLEYYNVRLIRFDHKAKCVGATHEYWSTETNESLDRSLLYIDDKNDGGAKADKFERDLRLLLDELKREPNNRRTVFYLASTYMSLGKYELAIKNYKRRTTMSNFFDDEVYYSLYQIAICHRRLGHDDKFIKYAWRAHHYDPSRVESLSHLTEYYFYKGKYKKAYDLAKKCYKTPLPSTPKLFLEPVRYQELSLGYMCSCAYYLGLMDLGLEYCERLLREYNGWWRLNGILPFYLRAHPLTTISEPLTSPQPARYPKNPSLVVADSHLLLNLQLVNYTMDPLMRYSMPGGNIETINYLARLTLTGGHDSNYTMSTPVAVPDDVDYTMSNIRGLEDARYLHHHNELIGTAVCWVDDGRKTDQPHIQVVRLRWSSDELTDLQIVDRTRVVGPNGPAAAEKNWLPLSATDDYIDLWYSCHPVRIVRYHFATKTLDVCQQYQLKGNYESVRGSAALRLPDDYHLRPKKAAYLLLMHEVFQREVEYQGVKGTPRSYYHRWLWLDDEYRPIRLSYPFYFFDHGVEYTTALVWYQGRLLSVICQNDHDSRLVEFDPEIVLRLSIIIPEYE